MTVFVYCAGHLVHAVVMKNGYALCSRCTKRIRATW